MNMNKKLFQFLLFVILISTLEFNLNAQTFIKKTKGNWELIVYKKPFKNELPRCKHTGYLSEKELIFSFMKTIRFQTFLFDLRGKPRGILLD